MWTYSSGKMEPNYTSFAFTLVKANDEDTRILYILKTFKIRFYYFNY